MFVRYAIFVIVVALPTLLYGSDVWYAPAFSTEPEALLRAAASLKPAKDTPATVLLSEDRYAFDSDGKLTHVHHLIYRVEDEEGVKGWAETSGEWEPWRQARPTIRARVITSDGALHVLDPKTLNDVPVHHEQPEVYSDRRSYGGPLPAVAVGAVVEEEIVTRDTAPYFAGGTVERRVIAWDVPVHHARVVLSHPESLPLRFQPRLLPDATIKKSLENGQETITIENGFLAPYPEKRDHLPPDVVPYAEIEFGTGTSWQKVAEEYARLTNNKVRSADVQPMLARINTKGASRAEVIGRIVAVLHKNVRYTGVEFDQASLVPQFPSETLKRKYGDCKDKAALLVSMLRAAGIPANLALLDTGPGQDLNVDLPGMGLFDHAIVYVPSSGNDAEMWIDATDEYARPGNLPYMDYGRWALIVDEKTTGLKKIPELTAAENVHREMREFKLPEFGLADIVEKDEDTGPRESEFRDFYSGDAKKVRESSEDYVKREYLADSLTSLKHDDLEDVSKPFSVTYVTKGKRGSTDFETASMAIRIESLFYSLPQYFTSEDEDNKKKEDNNDERAERKQPRVWDWQIQPFINEWDYKITAPPGFRLRALPPRKELQLGTARLSQNYSANTDGTVVEAVLRFENGKARLTVAEAEAMRNAVVQAEKSDPIFVTFDQVGHSLIAAGKIKEGLAAYHDLVRLHPQEALHRIQLARALLDAGLAEKARTVAREATTLDPKSAPAFSTLGWILQHDLIGRRFKKGFDYQGAVAAYRKAEELDPKDVDIRANLAMLLEYDAGGKRYSAQARLREAIAEFQELKKVDEKAGRRYDDFVLYDLWYTQDLKGLSEALGSLSASETRRAFAIAMVAVEEGGELALKKSMQVTSDEDSRRKAMSTAGWLLLRLRKYSEAAELLMASARGSNSEVQTTAFASNLRKTRRREDIKVDHADPRSVAQRLLAALFSDSPDYDQFRRVMAGSSLRGSDPVKDKNDFRRSLYQMRALLERSGVPIDVVGDIVLSNSHYSVEGSDAHGYKVTIESPGAPAQDMFVVREEGQYKVADFSLQGQKPPENLGWQALERLSNNDLPGARQWLDWARERVHMSGSDDPLVGQSFPYFWTKGQEGDASAVRTAALVLIPSKELKGEDLAGLITARNAASTERLKAELDKTTSAAYIAQGRWSDLVPIVERLLGAYPDSVFAFTLVSRAYARTGRFADWDKLVQEKMSKHLNEPEYTRAAVEVATYRGDYVKARALTKGLIEKSQATESDLNGYAWDALFLPESIGQDSIDAAERANQLSNNKNFSIMHTLACIYAQAGKPAQARDLLLKAMEESVEEPESAVWVALGEIAEQYGEADAARTMYGRVEKQEVEGPTSNYSLAQKRLAELNTPQRQ